MRRRGITLVEVLVAIAILILLAGVAAFVLSPIMGERKAEAKARTDLRQVGIAVAMYLDDNDGIGPHINIIPGFRMPKPLPMRNYQGRIMKHAFYRVHRHRQYTELERDFPTPFPFDPSRDPAACHYAAMEARATEHLPKHTDLNNLATYTMERRRQEQFLCGFVDGSVRWTWSPTENEASLGHIFRLLSASGRPKR